MASSTALHPVSAFTGARLIPAASTPMVHLPRAAPLRARSVAAHQSAIFRRRSSGPVWNAGISQEFHRNFTGNSSIPAGMGTESRIPNRASSISRSTARAVVANACLGTVAAAAADDDGGTEDDPYAEYVRLWPWGDNIPEPSDLEPEDIFTVQERFSRESTEARAALMGELACVFRPLLDSFDHFRSLKTRFDMEDHHIGMPFGALIACIGCYHLWKMNHSTFLDAALGYAFYRLSVVSLQLRKRGFSNDLVTRVKFVIMVIMAVNDHKNNLCMLGAIRRSVYCLYMLTFLFEVFGVKKCIKYFMAAVYCMLQVKDGRRQLAEIMSKHLSEIDNLSNYIRM